MKSSFDRFLKITVPIITPGVLIIIFIVLYQTLDEKITKEQLALALPLIFIWVLVLYYYKKIKKNI